MTKSERAALEKIRDYLNAEKSNMPLSAEYRKGVANQGAAGVINIAVDAINELLSDDTTD